MVRRIPIDAIAYWGTFLFSAIAMTYMLVTLVHLSTEEDTAFLDSSNYRQQIRYATVKTSAGDIKIAFMRSKAPLTTKNFLKLAESGFYDQTKFYYFPQGVFTESDLAPVTPLTREELPKYVFDDNVEVQNMTRGLIAMSRQAGGKIDGRLLLIFSEDDLPVASKEYVAFGRVIEGMDVVDKIRDISPRLSAGKRAPVSVVSVIAE